jgi:Tfp pilus assembly protein PilE
MQYTNYEVNDMEALKTKIKTSSQKLNFTLIEILTVCALLAFLMAMMIGAYGIVQQKGAESQCKATMERIKTALTSYKAKTGYYIQAVTVASGFYVDNPNPTPARTNPAQQPMFFDFIDYEKMKNAGEIDENSNPPRALVDPFGTNYRYQCPGKHNRTSFDLWSAGADGKDSTDEEKKDDIKNWE